MTSQGQPSEIGDRQGSNAAGASSKQHRFDFVVTLPRDRFAAFETIMRKPTSIAAAHLKFFDLRDVHPDWPRKAVVDDQADRPSDDLAVIQQVTSRVRSVENAWIDLPRAWFKARAWIETLERLWHRREPELPTTFT